MWIHVVYLSIYVEIGVQIMSLTDVTCTQGFSEAIIWVLSANPSRFFYEAMGGTRVGEREERLWGTVVNEIAYGWSDLKLALNNRGLRLSRPNYF